MSRISRGRQNIPQVLRTTLRKASKVTLCSRAFPRNVAAILLATSAAHVHADVCALARTQLGLLPYFVERHPNSDGNTEIRSDFDTDRRTDLLLWSPQESGSLVPSDYAAVTLTLSSSNTSFTLEETYIGVLQYRTKYYVVTTSLPDEQGRVKTVVYAVTRGGFKRLCAFAEVKSTR